MSVQEDATWDLEGILPGGLDGVAFREEADALEAEAEALIRAADALGEPGTDPAWDGVLPRLVAMGDRCHEAYMFAYCHAAVRAGDPVAFRAEARVSAINTRLDRAWTRPRDAIARCGEAAFQALCARPALSELLPLLQDLRGGGRLLLPPGEQALATELSEDGIHAWGRAWERIAAGVVIEGPQGPLSPAQALNRLEDPDPAVRDAVFAGMQAAWAPQQDRCADALTHIVGIRRTLSRRLGLDELDQPLHDNRLQRRTLEGLLQACREARGVLWRYLAAKARILGKSAYDWPDLFAPVGAGGGAISWAEARALVVREFGTFSPRMAAFADRAFRDRWVESEDRGGKRPGAFCASFPASTQSRVFMTYGRGMASVITLAHELGHAYHNEVVLRLHPARQRVTSSLAETASTFAEALVRGALLSSASDRAQELFLLDQELGDAANLLCNIPIRFEFERSLYALRAKGELDPSDLCERMEALQRDWYGPGMGRANPLFWAEKLHFYLSEVPFYNFPYTFGYLFSSLVHHRALAEGPAWADGYDALLALTGFGPAEEAARAGLGVEPGDPATWSPVIERIERQVARYETLAGS